MDSTPSTMTRSTTSLKQHPLNASLYETLLMEGPQFLELKQSIQENGVLEPLAIRSDGTIISGHRRHSVAVALGLSDVPVKIIDDGDDRQLIVEFNRYRTKTISERMREAELIEEVLKEKASAARAREGLARDATLPYEDKVGRVSDALSEAVGMKTRTFEKAKTIFEAAKTNANAKEKLERLDRGEISIDAAFKALRKLSEEHSDEKDIIPDFIRFYTSWQFVENDPRFGIPHPGRIPGQIPANVIYYFTEPGDLVVDPMAGGGSTIDAAEFLGREAIGMDVVPRRPDIRQHDIANGFPEYTKGAQLIFMDPPYWNMKDEGYSDASSSRMSLQDFRAWYRKLMENAAQAVRVGGFVAVINMTQFFRLPDDFEYGYIDWPFETFVLLRDADMVPWSRISVTYPTSLYGGYDIEASKKGRFLLPNVGDIIVMRRMV